MMDHDGYSQWRLAGWFQPKPPTRSVRTVILHRKERDYLRDNGQLCCRGPHGSFSWVVNQTALWCLRWQVLEVAIVLQEFLKLVFSSWHIDMICLIHVLWIYAKYAGQSSHLILNGNHLHRLRRISVSNAPRWTPVHWSCAEKCTSASPYSYHPGSSRQNSFDKGESPWKLSSNLWLISSSLRFCWKAGEDQR